LKSERLTDDGYQVMTK